MIDVVALGELLIDFAAKSTDSAGYPTMAATPGGAPGNFLAALNAYGRKTAFLGKVGNDAFGNLLLGTLNAAGIETKGILVDDSVFTTLAFVTFDESGDRSFSFARKPGVLEAIGHAGLSDVIVVVTRYFGGVLLGTGGLVRAYTAAASGALQQAEIVSMRLVTDCAVTVPYPKFEQAQRMIAAAGAKLQEPEYADAVTLRWRMPAGTEEALCHDLSELTRGSAEVTISKPLYAAF